MIGLHPSIASSFVTPSLCVLPLFLLPNNSKFPHSVNICQPVHYTIYKRSMQSEVNPNFTLNSCHSYHISVILLPTYTFCHSFFLHTIPQLLSLYLIVFFFFLHIQIVPASELLLRIVQKEYFPNISNKMQALLK